MENKLYKTTRYVPGTDVVNVFFSILPPKINNSGATLLLIIDSLVLLGSPFDVKGVDEKQVVLMGNAQAIEYREVSISDFMEEAGVITAGETEAVRAVLEARIDSINSSLNQKQDNDPE